MRRPSSIRDELLRPPVEYDPPRKKDNLFLWTVFLLLLVGVSMACWIGSYLVFARPELPLSYRLLRKIRKIDEPQRFKINAAPPGEFLGPEKLYARYNAMTPPKLRDANRELERAFLRNYPTSNGTVPYVTGRFTIMDTYELHAADFVPSGVVALAVAADFPKLLIEHVYSANPQDAPQIRRNLQTGMDIELRRTFELSAVLHATKLPDGRIQLTVVPINYGRYVYTANDGGFELHPPPTLNVSADWPIVAGNRLEKASQAYVDYRTRSGLGPLASVRRNDAGRPAPPAIKGVDVPVDVTPLALNPAVLPPSSPPPPTFSPPAVATTVTDAGKKPPGPGAVASPPALAGGKIPVLPAIPVEPVKRPGGAPVPALQPFLGGGPAGAAPLPSTVASASAPRATWAMYSPGSMPGGKNLHVNDVAALSQRGLGTEPNYLTGQFIVRAVGENKQRGVKNAILRSGSDPNVRVIVEYPTDRTLPAEGSEFNRDEQRPYQIMDVRRAPDGTVNVFAREITQPQG